MDGWKTILFRLILGEGYCIVMYPTHSWITMGFLGGVLSSLKLTTGTHLQVQVDIVGRFMIHGFFGIWQVIFSWILLEHHHVGGYTLEN